MPTKANGLKMEDYKRLVRVAKWAGLPNLIFHNGQTTIVLPLDGTYVAKLAEGHHPAPDVEPPEEEERKPHDWAKW
jgi:hypothetical protein